MNANFKRVRLEWTQICKDVVLAPKYFLFLNVKGIDFECHLPATIFQLALGMFNRQRLESGYPSARTYHLKLIKCRLERRK